MKEIVPNFKLPKNRYLELKYHCFQADSWNNPNTSYFVRANYAIQKYQLENAILSVNCDYSDILKDCVTHGVSYKKLKEKYGERMPEKEVFYESYKAFFYFLDQARNGV